MKTLLITVDYTTGTTQNGKGNFWANSYIKNKKIKQLPEESVHDTVQRAIKEFDFAEMCYNGKPQSDIYIDTDRSRKQVGYIYRVKHYIEDRHENIKCNAFFDAWVTISEANNIELTSCEY